MNDLCVVGKQFVKENGLLIKIIELMPEAIFFYFLVYGSSDPNFCILEKNKKIIFDFFYFLRCKKLPDLKKIIKIFKKKNKNCMILHCKNAEMTIIFFFFFFFFFFFYCGLTSR